MKTITFDAKGKSWLPMANLADAVIFGTGFGDVIVAAGSGTRGKFLNCTTVPVGLDYLAATVPCLRKLRSNQGSDGTDPQDFQIKIAENIFWGISPTSFDDCNHVNGIESCWERSETFQQLGGPKIRRMNGTRPQISLSGLPTAGAVVFGCPLPSKPRQVSHPYPDHLCAKLTGR
jgi:hypothetical protein